jgi:transposase
MDRRERSVDVNDSHRKHLPVNARGRHVVGIDIARTDHVAIGVYATGTEAVPRVKFTNDMPGIDRLERMLLRPLGGPAQILIAMESTGHYWMAVYYELVRRGYDVVVINAIQTRAEFRTRIRKTKNDTLDAASIARAVFQGKIRAARIPDEPVFELRMLARHRWRLLGQEGDLLRFAHSIVDRVFPEFSRAFSVPFAATVRAVIRHVGLAPRAIIANRELLIDVVHSASRGQLGARKVDELIERARRSIGIRIGEDVLVEQLRDVLELSEQIKCRRLALQDILADRVSSLNSPLESLGLSPSMVATIHGESDPISDFPHPWQYAAFTGLDPSTFGSGQYRKTVDTPISKRGSPHLRRALYLAASTLRRTHAEFARCYRRHRAKGRHHTDAVVIVAHKLARVVWRLLTDNRPFKAKKPKRPEREH